MKVYLLYLNYGQYDGGMDVCGIYSTQALAEAEYNRRGDDVPLIPADKVGSVLNDTVYFIDEWTVDE